LNFVNCPYMPLTRRQREVLDFVRQFLAERGYSPSLEEIGEHFGLSSVATVHKHVQHLVEKGYLRKAWNRSRSVEPVEPPSSHVVALPLLGTVAAGAPIEAVEVEESIEVPRHLVPPRGSCFVLRVRGDSMIDEQIRDGDTVVALLRGADATLKTFYRRGSNVSLQPANVAMEPIEVPGREVEIRGVVRGLLRRY
jgi:repressor LexA